jgi:CheY-like chemotaxis protein
MAFGSEILIVLVVEDEWLLRLAVAKALRDDGWSVIEAATGEGALGYLQAGQRVSLVVTDIQLGGDVDGWDIADAFRDRCSNLPIIYASGTSRKLDREVHGSVYLEKPLRMNDLLGACHRLLAA